MPLRPARSISLLLGSLAPLLGGCGDETSPAPDPVPCVPQGEEGTNVGQVVPNVALTHSNGAPTDLRALCPRKAAFVYAFAPW